MKREIVHSLTKVISKLDQAKIKEFLLPVFKETYTDEYANFKEGVAESICEIAHYLEEGDVTDELVPILLELLKDKSSIVKIRVAEGLVKMSRTLGPKMFSEELIGRIKDLLKEAQWRVRLSVYELMGEIGKEFGERAFKETLEELFLNFFSDKAAEVRKAGVKHSKILADQFGATWVAEKLVPRAFENYHNEEQGYLYRMCSLQAFSGVLKHISDSDLRTKFIPLLEKAAEDKVANVRFTAAKAVMEAKSDLNESAFRENFGPVLEKLRGDEDREVKYFVAKTE